MLILKYFKGQKSPGQYLVSNDGWTGDDLMHILDFVEQYSFGCWDELPKSIINRTPAGKLLYYYA
jgi:hypothetical protein